MEDEWSTGIWDDGEWISWDWVEAQLSLQEFRIRFPGVDPELARLFQDLVEITREYKERTGRYLPIFGELGELYAELKCGIKRHRACAAGSDGRLGNDFVEVKTITPGKKTDTVAVKRKGNFSKIIAVKVEEGNDGDEALRFEARMIDRKSLPEEQGPVIHISWSSMSKLPKAKRQARRVLRSNPSRHTG